MNVRCTQCQTVFRVDPEKVPAGGVRARCARCGAVFAMNRSGIAEAKPMSAPVAAPASAPVKPVPAPTLAATAPPAPARQPTTAAPPPAPVAPALVAQAPPAAPARPPAPAPAPAAPTPSQMPKPMAPPTTAPHGGAPAPSGTPAKRPSFLQQDPNTRAHRLARALVSDILAYNKDKLKQSIEAGTLKNDFREEIRKSWEEYVAQVGLEMAKGTTFFRDALNDILAKGQQTF